MSDKITQLLTQIKDGNRKSLARGISILENQIAGTTEILTRLTQTNKQNIIGITGAPGAGKSSLVNALLTEWVKYGKKIAVLAVDPSSPFNFGALLGDRIRMGSFYNNENVFIRSMASRGSLGGLAPQVFEVCDLLKETDFDYIIVETVGVGQSEVEIAAIADCTVVLLVPEGGDKIQSMKSGIMEIGDVFCINKSDREGADAMYATLKMMVHESNSMGKEEAEIIKTVATTGAGISQLAACIDKNLHIYKNNPVRKLDILRHRIHHYIMKKLSESIDYSIIENDYIAHYDSPDYNIYKSLESFINSSFTKK